MTDKIKDADFIEEVEGVDAPLFSAKELEAIKAQAKAEVIADKKAAAKKDMLAAEKKRLQREEGLTTGNSHMDEIVNVTIDLAPYADSIRVNGTPYWHGHSYPVPRHIAVSLQETMFQTWKHQGTIKGESLSEFYAKQHVDNLYKVGKDGTTSLRTFSAKGQ